MALAVAPLALAWASAPPGQYTVTADTVTDNKTLLTWQRAASAGTMGWAEAPAQCTGGWRLPNIRELLSLVDLSHIGPAVDATAFPNTPGEAFWSSTVSASNPNYAWRVNANGDSDAFSVLYNGRVRCVR